MFPLNFIFRQTDSCVRDAEEEEDEVHRIRTEAVTWALVSSVYRGLMGGEGAMSVDQIKVYSTPSSSSSSCKRLYCTYIIFERVHEYMRE